MKTFGVLRFAQNDDQKQKTKAKTNNKAQTYRRGMADTAWAIEECGGFFPSTSLRTGSAALL
jgi:hypothetical protein